MKHIFILRLIRKEDGSLISERDMDTMAEKDKDEAVNELNGKTKINWHMYTSSIPTKH